MHKKQFFSLFFTNNIIFLETDVTESSLISQVLLANADALCAPAVPLMDPDETLL